MDVFGRDSQLSANITEAKIPDSQDSNDGIFVHSQNSRENNIFYRATLTQIAKPSILQKKVRRVEKVNNNNEEEEYFNDVGGDLSFYNSFSLQSQAKHIGLKKRNPKMPHVDVLELATNELNRSIDTLTPIVNSSFLENSFNSTISELQIDSQESVQILKILKKDKPEEMKLERVEEDEEEQKSIDIFSTDGLDNEIMDNEIDEGFDQIDGFQEEPQEEVRLFDDFVEEQKVATSSAASEPVLDSVKIRIDVAEIIKGSDFAHESIDKNLLWAKEACPIPIVIDVEKWSMNGGRKIKLKFVRFLPGDGLDVALKDSKFAVEKCFGCFDAEKRNPKAAFFYISSTNPKYYWQPPTEEEKYFCLDVDDQKHRVCFNLTFACRENCMKQPDKRGKTMVLAAVVEDEFGNEICRDIFHSVRVTAYPRRDFRNYLDKKKKLKAEQAELLEQKNNVTDQPTATVNKQQRKRTTRYFQFGSGDPVPFDFEPTDNQQSTQLYTEMPKLKRNDEMEVDENMENAKKSRIEMVNTYHINMTFEKGDYEAVLECLANRAKQERYQATMTKSTRASPLSYLSKVDYYTKIEDWLKTMALGHHLSNFRQHAILAMGDLIYAYKKDPYFFEKLQIPNEEKLTMFRVFHNFYHVYLHENIKTGTH
ncbi:unnamed protein product [Caenorhabditis angaria]|uniref:Uncharacterized protein n=1 Tax=Caenorhabditis angaria TaxID=860376 RepID=A0A9P1I665_9PELO|nr:unnamed protein product [Caenorhabditis angaria]